LYIGWEHVVQEEFRDFVINLGELFDQLLPLLSSQFKRGRRDLV
jgi:hypothetical protein